MAQNIFSTYHIPFKRAVGQRSKIIVFKGSLGAPVHIHVFGSSLYTCLDLWFTFDQIIDVQYLQLDVKRVGPKEPGDSFYKHG